MMAQNAARVLVIEDNEDILLLFKTMLAHKNFLVLGKDNADEIESVVAGFSPNVILLDMLLSGQRNGLEICKQLKEKPSTQNIPIIIVSAHPGIEKSIEAGADFFIAKPFAMKDLLETIAKAIDL
jgi:DNA-binding response OmpR family regulator